MVAFPSGQMGGGLPPSGGAFGPSTGKQSGMNWGSINQFLEGPFQDLTEGLASVITKDNAYRAYINEKRSARRRQRLTDILSVPEMYANLAQKNPQAFAKLYGPGGTFDGEIQTTKELVRSQLVDNGLDPALADHYFTVVDAMTRIPPEAAELPDKVQVLQYAQQQGIQPGSPEWTGLGLGEQDAQESDWVVKGTYPGNGEEMVILQNRVTGELTSKGLSGRAAQQPLVSIGGIGVDSEGNWATGVGGSAAATGGATPAAGGGGPGGGAGIMPVGKPTYDNVRLVKERLGEMAEGVTMIDDLLGFAAKPGQQLGMRAGIERSVREFFRVGGDVAGVIPGADPAVRGIADLANRMIQQDVASGNYNPEVVSYITSLGDPATDAKALEGSLQYLNAKLRKGPDSRLTVTDVENAKAESTLFGLKSEQTVRQNLLQLRTRLVRYSEMLSKSANIGTPEEQPAPGVEDLTGKIPRLSKENADAEYAKLPSGTKFIDPDGKERIKP
jgi:hypothetical protein